MSLDVVKGGEGDCFLFEKHYDCADCMTCGQMEFR